MANLETIELTINGSAEQAKTGIDTLITSLGNLSDAITKPYSDLRDLCTVLKDIAGYCKAIRLPNIGKVTGGSAASARGGKAKQEYIPKGMNVDAVNRGSPNAVPDDVWKKNYEANHDRQVAEHEAQKQATANARERIRLEAEQAKLAANAAKQQIDLRGEQAKAIIEQSSEVDILRFKYDALKQSLIDSARAGTLSNKQLASGTQQLRNLEKQIEKVQLATQGNKKSISEVFSGLKKSISGFAKPLMSVYSRIKRIATTMLIRSAIRGLIKSMKEGVNNLYEWSKLNNGSFAKSMDTLKNKAGELKNSLGASIAPIIQAAIPVINNLANAAISAFNWVNQLISLLSGKSSWTKATEGVHDYTDAAKKAGGATQDWLASFDELNVMNSGGGGGSGSGATEYSDMFEEVYTFDSKIREIAEFLKENAQTIYDLAVATGATIIGWKLAKNFAAALPTLSTICGYLATAGVIAITLQVDWMLTNKYLKTGKEGWLFASALSNAVGATVAWVIANKLLGGGAGYYAAAITLTFTAITDIVAVIRNTDVSTFSKESIFTLIKAALLAGAAAGVMLKVAYGAAATPTLVAAGVGATALAVFGVAIGLKTSLDPNIKLFSKEFLRGTVIAALAVGLGAFLFFGAAAGGVAAIVTAGVVIAIKAITEADKITVDSSLITLTEEECKKYAKSKMFTIDPEVMVNIVTNNISVSENAESQVSDALAEAIGTINVIHLGLANDNDYAEIKEQIIGENGLIDKVNGWINSAESISKLVLKLTPSLVGETTEEQNQWYIDNNAGWETVRKFMNDIGKQLSDEIVEGEKGELIVKRPERVATLLEESARISEIIAGSDAATELNIKFSLGLEGYDSSSISQVIVDFYDYKEKMKEAAEELRETAYTNQARLVEALKYMLTIDPNNTEIKQKLAEAEAGLEEIKNNWKDGVDKAVDEMVAPGRQLLQEWIDNNIFSEHEAGSIELSVDPKVKFRMESEIANKFRNILQDDIDNAVDAMQYAFRTAGLEIPTQYIGDFLKFGGWDLLGEELQKAIMANVTINASTIEKLKEKLGMDASQIIKFSNYNKLQQDEQRNFITSLVSAYGSDAIAAIKKQLPAVKATDILKVSNWDKFKTSQKIEFLTALTASYGAKETIEAAKKCGINIEEAIKEGLNSKNDDVKKQAQKLNKIIKDNVETPSPKPKVEVQEDKNKSQQTKNDIKNRFSSVNSTVEVDVDSKTVTNARNAIVKGVSGDPISVKVNASLNNQSALRSSVKGAFNGIKLTLKDGNGTTKTFAAIAAAKSGGLFNSGDIFVANENGTSEMIGQFGNQTGVANQREIVAGIQKGVSDANAEQNALLRRQNEILLGILEKDNTVRIGASSAFGRIAKQSLDMYGTMVGG